MGNYIRQLGFQQGVRRNGKTAMERPNGGETSGVHGRHDLLLRKCVVFFALRAGVSVTSVWGKKQGKRFW